MRLQVDFERILKESGAVAMGVAPALKADPRHAERLRKWLADGFQAGMQYMERYFDLRMDPTLLLPGARSVIALAFNYTPASPRPATLPQIASYALGLDYHDVIRARLQKCVSGLENAFGGEYRICIDSAPTLDRMWAELSGIGTRCDNGLICVDGCGTRTLLAEIMTTLPIEVVSAGDEDPNDAVNCRQEIGETSDSKKVRNACTHCGACRRACPAGALQADGTVDARRCLSYLTIEQKGEWDAVGQEAMRTPAGRNTLFGCDICQNVCHLNRNTAATEIPEFQPLPGLLDLTAEEVAAMTQEEFSRIFRGSPLKRSKLAGLRRNALNALPDPCPPTLPPDP